jgi:hypothetical protein
MPSASKKLDVIRKRKDKPSKSNRKTDAKRIAKNREILKGLSSSEKSS